MKITEPWYYTEIVNPDNIQVPNLIDKAVKEINTLQHKLYHFDDNTKIRVKWPGGETLNADFLEIRNNRAIYKLI